MTDVSVPVKPDLFYDKKKSAVYKDNVKNTDCIDSVTSTMNNKRM